MRRKALLKSCVDRIKKAWLRISSIFGLKSWRLFRDQAWFLGISILLRRFNVELKRIFKTAKSWLKKVWPKIRLIIQPKLWWIFLKETWFIATPLFLWIANVALNSTFNSMIYLAFNKLFSLVINLLGIGILVYSINSDLKLFKKPLISARINAWLRKMPLFIAFRKKGRNVSFTGCARDTARFEAKVSMSKPKPENLEDQVSHLWEEVKSLKEQHQEDWNRLKEELNSKTRQNETTIEKTGEKISVLSSKVEETLLEGIGLQIFGLLLSLHPTAVEIIEMMSNIW